MRAIGRSNHYRYGRNGRRGTEVLSVSPAELDAVLESDRIVRA